MSEITVSVRGAIGVVTMKPADIYMTAVTTEALAGNVDRLLDDPDIRVLVLTGGHPGIFIQHYDVGELAGISADLRRRGRTFSEQKIVPPRQLDQLFQRFHETDKVIVAAINGNAMGGGFELALAADMRIAEKGPYRLGLPEINLGILPGAGGTQRLSRLVGQARALEMILRGRTVTPETALDYGMVHELSPGPVLPHALLVAEEFAGKSPLAVKHIKRLIRQEAESPLPETLGLERTLFLDLLVSDAAAEQMDRFNASDKDIRRPQDR